MPEPEQEMARMMQACGLIIGKGGERINQLRDTTQAGFLSLSLSFFLSLSLSLSLFRKLAAWHGIGSRGL